MTKTTIINISKKNLKTLGYADLEDWLKDDNHVYIGRKQQWVAGTTQSKWHNPFSVQKYGRDGCLKKYTEYLKKDTKLLSQIDELKGKTLGCWCKPLECHGDILIDLCNK